MNEIDRVGRQRSKLSERSTALDEIVAHAGREEGQGALARYGVEKHVGLVGALIDGGTAKLREPDGLGLRHPHRGRGKLAAHPRRPVEVLVEPPGADVLEAEHPRLAQAVADR